MSFWLCGALVVIAAFVVAVGFGCLWAYMLGLSIGSTITRASEKKED